MVLRKKIRDMRLSFFKKPTPKPDTKKMIDEFITNDDIVLEIGASFGGATIYLSSKARFVHSFEPNPMTFSILKRTTKKIKNLKIYNLAAGNEDCSKQMYVPVGDHASSAAGFKKFSTQKYDGKTVETKVIRLDNMKFIPEPNVLLLDCEGYEIEALKATDLSKFNKILVEVHEMQQNSYSESKRTVINLLQNFKIIDSDYLVALK
jgi:FkbM family methyltransferase